MKDGGPKTYRGYMGFPEAASVDVRFRPEEEAYEAGVDEGIRWERHNELRKMAKAAMTGLLAANRLTPPQTVAAAYSIAENMLAVSEGRNEARESNDGKA